MGQMDKDDAENLPYTLESVRDLQGITKDLAKRMLRPDLIKELREIDEDALDALLYDALLELEYAILVARSDARR